MQCVLQNNRLDSFHLEQTTDTDLFSTYLQYHEPELCHFNRFRLSLSPLNATKSSLVSVIEFLLQNCVGMIYPTRSRRLRLSIERAKERLAAVKKQRFLQRINKKKYPRQPNKYALRHISFTGHTKIVHYDNTVSE